MLRVAAHALAAAKSSEVVAYLSSKCRLPCCIAWGAGHSTYEWTLGSDFSVSQRL